MIGFFPGTFDPIHLGHLNLAIRLKEAAGLKEVWFCPAFRSPFKLGIETASPEDRLKMVQLAIKGIKGFRVLDLEIRKGAPSYTIDTIRELIQKTGEHFRLILGEDNVTDFTKWKEADKLAELAPLLIGARTGCRLESALLIPLYDISATDIRLRREEGLYIGHQVPASVLSHIKKNKLYL